MLCQNCRTIAPDGSQFCPKCGASLASSGVKRTPPPFPSNVRYPTQVALDDLASKLEPTYLKKVPRLDGWENSFQYEAFSEDGEDEDGPAHYRIISAGKDRQLDPDEYLNDTATKNFNNDIVFSDGEFIVYPEMTH